MSDGFYSFHSSTGNPKYEGRFEVQQGRFHGRNDFYIYKGAFEIENKNSNLFNSGKTLRVVISIESIINGEISRIDKSIPFISEDGLLIPINFNGEDIRVLCQKLGQAGSGEIGPISY